MLARVRRFEGAFLGGALLALSACASPGEQVGSVPWPEARRAWEERRPRAHAAWSELARREPRSEAAERLTRAAALYEDGLRALEAGAADATERLRAGAEVAPIDPALYPRLARACRAQGAIVRAADFYRKYLAETEEGPTRAEVASELAEIGREIGDPFSTPSPRPLAPIVALALAVVALAVILLLRRRVRLDRLLARHPERAPSFAYLANVLRHELLKHRIGSWRGGGPSAPRVMAEPIERAWRRHLDGIGAALGLPRAWSLREPCFRRAERAMSVLARAERDAVAPPTWALDALRRLDAQLVAWTRLLEHTRVDRALLESTVDSLRDERPARSLPVAIDIVSAESAPTAMVFRHDLLLVLRNLVRNAIAEAERSGGGVRIDAHVHVDPAGQAWVRVLVHDGSLERPPAVGPADRGLGLVRETLERYGGALLEVGPAAGYRKALAISLPSAELDAPQLAAQERRAA